MPTYEYRREDGTTFEIRQRITADPLETCPDTGQPVERMISAGAGLIFKGDGFYVTDYVRNGNGDSKQSSDTTNTSEDGADEKSSKKVESET